MNNIMLLTSACHNIKHLEYIFTTNRKCDVALGTRESAYNGYYGMTQSEMNLLYANTTLNGLVTCIGVGYQKFIIPKSGKYIITCEGADGGYVGPANPGSTSSYYGGRGAILVGSYNFTKNQIIYVLVGHHGWCNNNVDGGGGGGGASAIFLVDSKSSYTFSATNEKVKPIIVAGGGAGRTDNANNTNSADDTRVDSCALNAKWTNGASTNTGTSSNACGGGGLTSSSTGSYIGYGLLLNTVYSSSGTNSSWGYKTGGFLGGGGSFEINKINV